MSSPAPRPRAPSAARTLHACVRAGALVCVVLAIGSAAPAAAAPVAGAASPAAPASARSALPAAPAWPRDPIVRPDWQAEVAAFAQQAGEHAAREVPGLEGVRVEIGSADPRLRLAPCDRVQAHAPPGLSPLGRTRVGLRCAEGEGRWSITVPVTVRVFAPAWVATGPLAAGATLSAGDLRVQRVDIAGDRSAALPATPDTGAEPHGRELAMTLAAGEPLRQRHLKARQWFAAGDAVRLQMGGAGFQVTATGQALQAGIEGQAVRVRTEGGRIVVGTPSGEHRVDVAF